MNRLKYSHCDIVFQEVPNEVSLAVNISGCPHHCEGCHSQYLWEYEGKYISDDLDEIVNKYDGLLTCICFMGGDQNMLELTDLLFKVKHIYGLKTCVYSGNDNIETFCDVLPYLDYLKIGRFNIGLGGLDKKETNQKFYKIINSKLEDITSMFYK